MFGLQGSLEEEGRNVEKDGTFVISQLPAGTVVLRPEVYELSGEPVRILIPEGTAHDVVLRLDVTPTWVRVNNWSPALGSFATLLEYRAEDVQRVAPRMHERPVSMAGALDVTGIDLGSTYSVWIPPRQPQDSLMVYVREMRLHEGDNVVTAEDGLLLAGKVVGAEGKTDLQVWLTGDGVNLSRRFREDGSFEFRGVPPGEWTVGAAAFVGDHRFRAETRVKAGTTDVELTLAEYGN